MEHLTTTPDVRDLDCLFLATIAGDDYYETRQIVRQSNGVRTVVGVGSDWPIIQRDARIRELTALLVASERRSVEADCHVSELIARLSAYEEQMSREAGGLGLETGGPQATETSLQTLAPSLQNDGRIPCDEPGCLDWVKVRGLAAHKRKAHGVVGPIGHKPIAAPDPSLPMVGRKKCPHCAARPKAIGLAEHIKRDHPDQVSVVVAPAPIAIALGEAPWRCASCGKDTHTRSITHPALCTRCVVTVTDAALSNGHHLAAA